MGYIRNASLCPVSANTPPALVSHVIADAPIVLQKAEKKENKRKKIKTGKNKRKKGKKIKRKIIEKNKTRKENKIKNRKREPKGVPSKTAQKKDFSHMCFNWTS